MKCVRAGRAQTCCCLDHHSPMSRAYVCQADTREHCELQNRACRNLGSPWTSYSATPARICPAIESSTRAETGLEEHSASRCQPVHAACWPERVAQGGLCVYCKRKVADARLIVGVNRTSIHNMWKGRRSAALFTWARHSTTHVGATTDTCWSESGSHHGPLLGPVLELVVVPCRDPCCYTCRSNSVDVPTHFGPTLGATT